jgi:molybdate transport system substrate-binding protein
VKVRRLWPALAIAAVAVACGGAPAGSGQPTVSITVFAAASLTDAFGEAAEVFRARKAHARVVFSFGSSSTLATQIASGAHADVFASADELSMGRLVDAHLVDDGPGIFAIAVAPGNPKKVTSLADLARPGMVVVLAAPTVPAGKYAAEALAKASVRVTPASQELDVRAVLNKVALGEADAGIVYATDLRAGGARVSGVAIPESQQVVARYPIAVVTGSAEPSVARAFVDFVLSDDGQALLARYGFTRP